MQVSTIQDIYHKYPNGKIREYYKTKDNQLLDYCMIFDEDGTLIYYLERKKEYYTDFTPFFIRDNAPILTSNIMYFDRLNQFLLGKDKVSRQWIEIDQMNENMTCMVCLMDGTDTSQKAFKCMECDMQIHRQCLKQWYKNREHDNVRTCLICK